MKVPPKPILDQDLFKVKAVAFQESDNAPAGSTPKINRVSRPSNVESSTLPDRSAVQSKTRTCRWYLVLGLLAAGPLMVTLLALAIVLFHFLGNTELTLLDNGNAPESSTRLITICLVILLNSLVATSLVLAATPCGYRGVLMQQSGQVIDSLLLAALVAIGTAFALSDMSFNVAESTESLVAVLLLGLIAAAPLFLRQQIAMRRMLVAIAVYAVFAGWIAAQRHIDWNMQVPFRRAYSQIHAGMSGEQVESVMNREFRGKRPIARIDRWGVQYSLDPDDGRYNAEFIIIHMIDGKVSSTEYLFD
jgi:hypothetical protein